MRKGFTLIETIVVMVIVGIISLIFAAYVREGFEAWVFFSGQKGLAFETRAALYRVVREIKLINHNLGISTHTSQQISFEDIYGNPVTFSQEGTRLRRNNDILLENLENPNGLTFSYFDKNGSSANFRENIYLVRIRLVTVKGQNRFVIESAAALRNEIP